jgi:hypothetical protein
MKTFGMIYSLGAYLIGVGSLFWVFLAAGGLVPYGLSEYKAGSGTMSILINLSLVTARK